MPAQRTTTTVERLRPAGCVAGPRGRGGPEPLVFAGIPHSLLRPVGKRWQRTHHPLHSRGSPRDMWLERLAHRSQNGPIGLWQESSFMGGLRRFSGFAEARAGLWSCGVPDVAF